MADSDERRKSTRKDVRWPISVSTKQGVISGETVNISADGVSICCDEPVPLDQILKLSILPPDHGIIEIAGRITWSDLCGIDDENQTVGIGLCFMEINDRDREFFAKMVSEDETEDPA